MNNEFMMALTGFHDATNGLTTDILLEPNFSTARLASAFLVAWSTRHQEAGLPELIDALTRCHELAEGLHMTATLDSAQDEVAS